MPRVLLQFVSLLCLTSSTSFFFATAHPVCRSCTKNCYTNLNSTLLSSNSTVAAEETPNDNLIEELQSNRIKRSVDETDEGGGVMRRSCTRFQIEMLLIPIAIAMMPIVLCSLFLCTCCCGEKEARGKLPEDFIAKLPMSAKRKRLTSEELELEFTDDYVRRKNSAKTKFSRTISVIEARRESLWSMQSSGPSSPNEIKSAETEQDNVLGEGRTKRGQLERSRSEPVTGEEEEDAKENKTGSIKRTRFSDTVSVIDVTALGRR